MMTTMMMMKYKIKFKKNPLKARGNLLFPTEEKAG